MISTSIRGQAARLVTRNGGGVVREAPTPTPSQNKRGRSWVKSEVAFLLKAFQLEWSWMEMGRRLNRTPNSVRAKAYSLGVKRFTDGNTEIDQPKSATLRNRSWNKRNPEKRSAHRAVWRALDAGLLTRKPCEGCGSTKVHAHHPDYSKPLFVRWLCPKCHNQIHRRAAA